MLHLLCGSWLSAVKSALPVTVNAWRAWIPFCYQNHVPHFPIFPICPVFICLCFHLTFQNSSVLGVIVYTAHSSVLTYDQVENLFILIDHLLNIILWETSIQMKTKRLAGKKLSIPVLNLQLPVPCCHFKDGALKKSVVTPYLHIL